MQSLEEVQGAHDIDLQCSHRIAKCFGHPALGGEVDDGIGRRTRNQPVGRRRIGEVEAYRNFTQRHTRKQRVAADEPCQRRTHESVSPGDQQPHSAP